MHEFKDLSGNIIRFTYEDVINAFNTDIEELICNSKINGTAQGTEYNYVYQNKVYGPKALMRCIAYNTNQRIDNLRSDKHLRGLFDKLGFERQQISLKSVQDYFLQKVIDAGLETKSYNNLSECSVQQDGKIKLYYVPLKDGNLKLCLKGINIPSETKLEGVEIIQQQNTYPKSYNQRVYFKNCKLNKVKNFLDNLLEQALNIEVIDEILDNDKNNKGDDMTKQPLNQILYGPPGTGKTYNTVVKAMEIVGLKELFKNWYMKTSNAKDKDSAFRDYCNSLETLNMNFKVAIFHILDKNIFKKLKSEITKSEYFVNNCKHAETSSGTSYYDSALNQYGKFLNNLTYEDLKTEFNELRKQGRIEFVTFHQSYSYEEFVEGIKPDIESWGSSVENLTYKGCDGIFKKICERAEEKFVTANFDDVYDKFLEEISNKNGLFELTTKKYKKIFRLEVNNNDNLNAYLGTDFKKQGSLTKENIKAHFLNTRKRIDWASYYDSVVEYLETKYHLKKQKIDTQPFVLIIDEINRGNISKIFGELITLIEDDKRSSLKVKLPYSHEEFTVPKNLYIIGTMNTSDRSIASIDIALRRRFKFVEMMPSNEIEGFRDDFKERFEILNRRISFLLDRDHQIGHSYFLNEKEKLEDVWFDSVMPLLNEYFYGDWDKLQNILGKAEVENKNKDYKYNSFIKEIKRESLDLKGETSCLEDYYYDFVPQKYINFEEAMKNAFGDAK